MARPLKDRENALKADVTYDDADRKWVASTIGPDGAKVTAPPQGTTTQAVSRLELVLRSTYGESLAVEPEVHVPKSLKAKHRAYTRELPKYIELSEFIKKERLELAIALYEMHVPVRTIATMIGFSPQRVGAMLNNWVMKQSESSQSKRSRKTAVDEDEE